MVNPNELVIPFTAENKNGEAISKKRRPAIRETIHLSFEV